MLCKLGKDENKHYILFISMIEYKILTSDNVNRERQSNMRHEIGNMIVTIVFYPCQSY